MDEETPHYIEKVINPEELLNETSSGWTVVERFEHDAAVPVFDPTPGESPRMLHYGQPSMHMPYGATKTVLGRVSSFRLRLSSECLVGDLQRDVERLKGELCKSREEREKVEAELKKEHEAHVKVSKQFTDLCEENKRIRNDRQQIEQIKRDLERDIGRIREVIGRKQFEEILPLKATPER